MTMMTLTQNEQPVSSGFRVDVSRGERVGRVSSEWFSRPGDERYLSLTDLYGAVRRRAERAQTRTVGSRSMKVEAVRDNAERLAGVSRIWGELGLQASFVAQEPLIKLPFAERRFDLAWNWAALWYLKNAGPLLRELVREAAREKLPAAATTRNSRRSLSSMRFAHRYLPVRPGIADIAPMRLRSQPRRP